MSDQKKYKTWNSIGRILSKTAFQKPYKLSTFILDTFLENDGIIESDDVYKLKLCNRDAKEFTAWRKKLCDDEWLNFVIDTNKFVTYTPGKKLLPYINKEKIKRSEIATKDDLKRHLKAEISPIEHRVKKLETAMERVLNIIDPPADNDKAENFAQGGYDDRLLKLVQQKDGSL